jgi:uncharacterized glyoxalase superfamily protein PhnB
MQSRRPTQGDLPLRRDASGESRSGRLVGQGHARQLPLEKTFWTERFGMLVDRFGIPWLINGGGSEEPPGG